MVMEWSLQHGCQFCAWMLLRVAQDVIVYHSVFNMYTMLDLRRFHIVYSLPPLKKKKVHKKVKAKRNCIMEENTEWRQIQDPGREPGPARL